MIHARLSGFTKSVIVFCFSLLCLLTSCSEDENSPVNPDKDAVSLDPYYTLLEEASGVDRSEIVYDTQHETFTVSGDMVVSRSMLDTFLGSNPEATGRTEQRMHNILLSDANARNFKYYLQPTLTTGWRDAVIQAIAQWNNVGGSKLKLVQVSTQAEANINVFMGTSSPDNWVARATLPTTNGKGYLEINPRFNNMAANQKLFAMAHEMGHNIGFWHTNQTTGTLIPGTPESDPNSVMNSFVLPWNGFTNYDLVAVRYLYPGPVAFGISVEAESYTAMKGVRTQNCLDTNGGLNVGYIHAGDYMSYANINIPEAGSYRIEYRVASPGGGQFSSDLNNGATALGTITFPATGGWQKWTTVSHVVTLPAGNHTLTIRALVSSWNINWFKITKV